MAVKNQRQLKKRVLLKKQVLGKKQLLRKEVESQVQSLLLPLLQLQLRKQLLKREEVENLVESAVESLLSLKQLQLDLLQLSNQKLLRYKGVSKLLKLR